MKEVAIAVFARSPVAGGVKTRLIPALGPEGALAAYEKLLDATLAAATATQWPAFLYGTEMSSGLVRRADSHDMPLRSQETGNLGDRMTAAFRQLHGEGYRFVILIGSDCPLITPDYLHQAFHGLASGDFVLGPAEDGGYVLLGSGLETAWHVDPLASVRWSSAETLDDTLRALSPFGDTVLLETLWDMDNGDDWRRAREAGLLD